MPFEDGISRTVDWYKFFLSVVFPGGIVGQAVSESPLGNPFTVLEQLEAVVAGSSDEDLETNSNVLCAPCQIPSRKSRLNLSVLAGIPEAGVDKLHIEETTRDTI